MSDVILTDYGSLNILHPASEEGECWLAENLSADTLRYGGGYVVESRYLPPIVEGLESDGLQVTQ